MSPYFAFFLGLFTAFFIGLLIYATATVSQTFLALYYNPTFCTIGQNNNTNNNVGTNNNNNQNTPTS